jgi:hypothetical protein
VVVKDTEMEAEQAFSTDLEYYEDRAAGFAGVAGVTAEEARRDLAARHGFLDWDELVRHVGALRERPRAALTVRARLPGARSA